MKTTYVDAHATCRTCGTKSLQVSFSGRKPDYCSPECRNVMKYWNAFKRELDKVDLSEEKKKLWAGEIFRLRNDL